MNLKQFAEKYFPVPAGTVQILQDHRWVVFVIRKDDKWEVHYGLSDRSDVFQSYQQALDSLESFELVAQLEGFVPHTPCDGCVYNTGLVVMPCVVNPLAYGRGCRDYTN